MTEGLEVRRGETAEAAMMRTKKKCPECVKAGLRSRIYVGMATGAGLIPTGAYYDEDGAYHPSAPVKARTHYRCSNGHEWKETV